MYTKIQSVQRAKRTADEENLVRLSPPLYLQLSVVLGLQLSDYLVLRFVSLLN